MKSRHQAPWWGAPKKFSPEQAERKISWLELFYDLVYAVAIAKITSYFAQHANLSGFLDYVYLFIMVFWGWFNGSMYHDLHGTPGIRTRLMTLWQMVAVAAMIICLNSPQDKVMVRGTIAIMVMQFYITYIWWSVGIYDKEHRRLNKPFTAFYLVSLGLIFSTLYLPEPWVQPVFFASLVCNFLPPFYVAGLRGRKFNLSASMTERLGLFTIILFGEVVTDAINGATTIQEFTWLGWGNFVLAILIIFAMWWIFFAIIADRPCQEGFLKGQTMTMLYIPILMSLGMLGVAFPGIFSGALLAEHAWQYRLFATLVGVFLAGIVMLSNFLVYTDAYLATRRGMQGVLITVALIITAVGCLFPGLPLMALFSVILTLLISVIVIITKIWVKIEGVSAPAGTAE